MQVRVLPLQLIIYVVHFCHNIGGLSTDLWDMSLERHIQDLRNWVSRPDLESAALVASNEAIALRQLTIQERGQGVNGDFSDYTDSYARDRTKAGYQTEYKDYTRTGELFRSISPEIISSEPTAVTVEIGARGVENENKLRGAFKKDENILTNTEDELQTVQAVFIQRINKGLPF